MPFVVFALEFADAGATKVPVSCDLNKPIFVAITALNRKLQGALCIPPKLPATGVDRDVLDVRLPSAAPIDALGALVGTLPAAVLGGAANPKPQPLMLISPFPAPANLAELIGAASPTLVQTNVDADSAGVGEVTVLGPKLDAASAAADVSEDDEDAEEAVIANADLQNAARDGPLHAKDAAEAGDALHLMEMDGAVRKVLSKACVPMAGVVCFERPVLSVAYPMQLAQCIKGNSILRTRTHDPNAATSVSSISGVGDSDFTKFLSIAVTHGRTVKTESRFDRQLAFHPKCLSIPHSCSPSCSFTYNAATYPYTGVVRCGRAQGLGEGDDVTVLHDAVNRPEFLMLPVDRRRKLLQKRYHYTCRCDRCMKSGAGPTSNPALMKPVLKPNEIADLSVAERESTLTGAFWGDSVTTAARRSALSLEMRDSFASLGIASGDDGCSLLVDNVTLKRVDPHTLLSWICKYSAEDAPLVLHRHHWRLSFVRIAYLRRVAGSATTSAGTLSKKDLARETFNVAIQQLAVESVFIPSGHPQSLPTYRAFRRLVRALPPALAAKVQKDAVAEIAADWAVLQRLDERLPLKNRKAVA